MKIHHISKTVTAVALSVLAIALFTSCSKDDSSSASTPPPAASKVLYVPLTYGSDNYAGSILGFDTASKQATIYPMPGNPENMSAVSSIKPEDASSGLMYDRDSGLIYGHLAQGGNDGEGAIFEYDPANDKFRILYSFAGFEGSYPAYAPILVNGNLIGVTLHGGKNGTFVHEGERFSDPAGTIYSYSLADENLTVLYDFNCSDAIGCASHGQIMKSSYNGAYYGSTSIANNDSSNTTGGLWEFNNGTMKHIITMSLKGRIAERGTYLYYSSYKYHGEELNTGSIDLSKNYTHSQYTAAGHGRLGSGVIRVGDKVFGIASEDGELGGGTIIEMGNGNFAPAVRYPFSLGSEHQPLDILEGDFNGIIYGTLHNSSPRGSGLSDPGGLFQYDVLGSYHSLYTASILPLTPTGLSQKFISAPVKVGTKLYGISASGSDDLANEGVLYEFDIITQTYSVKVDFGHSSGKHPRALTKHSNGKIYGTAYHGGLGGVGLGGQRDAEANAASFVIDPKAGSITPFAHSDQQYFAHIASQFIEGKDGKLYAATYSRTSSTTFTNICAIDPDTAVMEEKVLHGVETPLPPGVFVDTRPNSPLLFINNKYYGTTKSSIYEVEVDPADNTPLSNILVHLFTDTNTSEGRKPRGIIDVNSTMLYGVTEFGGDHDSGVIFKIAIAPEGSVTPTNTPIVKVYDFNTTGTDGMLPSTAPAFHNGFIYGATLNGGVNDGGVLYRLEVATDSFTVLHSFGSGDEGSHPRGSVYIAEDGRIYGTTTAGTDNGLGGLYSCNIDGNCIKEYSFTKESGYGASYTQINEL